MCLDDIFIPEYIRNIQILVVISSFYSNMFFISPTILYMYMHALSLAYLYMYIYTICRFLINFHNAFAVNVLLLLFFMHIQCE